MKNGTEVTLKTSSNVAGDSNDKNNFCVSCYQLRKVFENNASVNIKLSNCIKQDNQEDLEVDFQDHY